MTNPPKRRSDAAFFRLPSRRERAGLALCAAVLTALMGTGYAADSLKAVPPAAQAGSASAAISPLVTTPAEALATIANGLAKDGAAIVVTVGGMPVTKANVADAMRALPASMASLGFKELYRHVVDQLISEDLATLSGVKIGLDKDPDVRRRQKTASDRALADAWINHEADVAVTEQALRARYDRDIAGKPGPVEVRTRVILVPTESEALNIIGKIQGGAAFDDLARQFSRDTTAAAGGDLGYVSFASLAPEAAITAFALAPGQITSYPVHAQAGYFILRVEGRRQRTTPSFDDVRDGLVRDLRREAGAAAVRALTADIKLASPATGDGMIAASPGGATAPNR